MPEDSAAGPDRQTRRPSDLKIAAVLLAAGASRRLEQPVISVGNLSAGGSGKTPFVIALGELFKARGIRFDVLLVDAAGRVRRIADAFRQDE